MLTYPPLLCELITRDVSSFLDTGPLILLNRGTRVRRCLPGDGTTMARLRREVNSAVVTCSAEDAFFNRTGKSSEYRDSNKLVPLIMVASSGLSICIISSDMRDIISNSLPDIPPPSASFCLSFSMIDGAWYSISLLPKFKPLKAVTKKLE